MANKKVETKEYISCPRCKENNWDNPKFWGCPRGGCEVEVKGEIVISKELIKSKKENGNTRRKSS